MSPSFFHVLFWVLAGAFVIIFLQLHQRRRERLVEKIERRVFIPRGYTLKELAEYNGRDKHDVFIAIKGIIYSASREWYGPDGSYHAFAACDCSRHLGKVVVGTTESNADWTTLSDVHRKSLNEWEESLRSKYTPVGWIIDTDDFVDRAKAFSP